MLQSMVAKLALVIRVVVAINNMVLVHGFVKGGSVAASHNDARFVQESIAFPGHIPRVIQSAFDTGKYSHSSQMDKMVQWRCVSEYLSMAKLVQSKINNYKEFLDHAERSLQINALEA